jgi:OOP family OmpA-OmpF porin
MALPFASAAQAIGLTPPGGAEVLGQRSDGLASHPLPVGPWRDGVLPVRQTEGALTQTAWRLPLEGRNTLELLAPLREQAAAQGFQPIFECDTLACGGFDFRYGTDILPEPQMHVDLGDFRFFAAERAGEDGPEFISLVVSRSATQGFVQLTRIGPALKPPPQVVTSTMSQPAPAQPALTPPVGMVLTEGVPYALDDVTFAPGKAALTGPDPSSLRALVTWLAEHPDRSVELVGHTDSSGNPDSNTALSLARAEALRDRLIAAGIAPERVTARGAGPAFPRADNATAEGRQKNRRVEVMLTPTR